MDAYRMAGCVASACCPLAAAATGLDRTASAIACKGCCCRLSLPSRICICHDADGHLDETLLSWNTNAYFNKSMRSATLCSSPKLQWLTGTSRVIASPASPASPKNANLHDAGSLIDQACIMLVSMFVSREKTELQRVAHWHHSKQTARSHRKSAVTGVEL